MSEWLKQIVQILASVLFSWIISKSPEFPLTENQFIALIVYFFTLMGVISGLRYQWHLFQSRILKNVY